MGARRRTGRGPQGMWSIRSDWCIGSHAENQDFEGWETGVIALTKVVLFSLPVGVVKPC